MIQKTDGERRNGLGGSEAAAVLGLNPWESAFDIWVAKTSGEERPFHETKWIDAGNRAEEVIAKVYSKRWGGVYLIESPRLRSAVPGYEFMTGTPDRLIVDRTQVKIPEAFAFSGRNADKLFTRGIEIKTAQSKHLVKWHPNGHITPGRNAPMDADSCPPMELRTFQEACGAVPMNYWMQCQWYMNLMDFPEWSLIVRVDSAEYFEYLVHYDEAFMAKALPKCKWFWEECVMKKAEPPLDWGKLVPAHLQKFHPRDNGEIRTANSEEAELILQLKEVTGKLDVMKAQKKELVKDVGLLQDELRELDHESGPLYEQQGFLQNQLRDKMGDFAGLRSAVGEVTWKNPKTDRTKSRIFRKRFK